MKQFVVTDPATGERIVVCTFNQTAADGVTVEYAKPGYALMYPFKRILTEAGKELRPSDAGYYAALDGLFRNSTFCEFVSDDA
jgi:hypothetical protein